MTNARKELAAYLTSIEVKRDQIRVKETELARLQDIIAAPSQTESMASALVRKTAAFLLGRGNDVSDEGAELEQKLSRERHRAEAAKLAAAHVEQQIAELHQEVMDLESKDHEYIAPIMI
jgi:chromosome segregation ATPase